LGKFFTDVEFFNIFKQSYPIPFALFHEKRPFKLKAVAMFKKLTFLSFRSPASELKENSDGGPSSNFI